MSTSATDDEHLPEVFIAWVDVEDPQDPQKVSTEFFGVFDNERYAKALLGQLKCSYHITHTSTNRLHHASHRVASLNPELTAKWATLVKDNWELSNQSLRKTIKNTPPGLY